MPPTRSRAWNSAIERIAIRTFSSSANWARMPPAALLVEPAPRASRSRRTTSVRPSFARWYATLVPIAPPPMITTSADSTTPRSYAWPVKDKVALVTGAGRGIGRATALALASRGARVMAASRTEEELAALAREASVEYVAETVATALGCERIVVETQRRLGPIDILVNNAGIGSARERAIWKQDPDAWRETLAVNLDGPFHLTRLAAADMVERRWGRIVMVSSTAGEIGGAAMSAYCASKHGVLGLMRAVAQDVGPFEVTCNAVLPGWVRTEMAERSAAGEAERRGVDVAEVWSERATVYPAGRVVAPEEIAATISFLASEEASGINGEAVTVALGGVW